MTDDTTGGGSGGRTVGQKLKHAVHSKVLIPVATTVVSAAATYLVRKLPMILEEKVLPKLREAGAPEQLQNALEQAGQQIEQLTGGDSGSRGDEGDAAAEASSEQEQDAPQAESEAAGQEEQEQDQEEPSSGGDDGGPELSSDEREEERRKREERRRERRAVGNAS
jgi:hypothetical protein